MFLFSLFSSPTYQILLVCTDSRTEPCRLRIFSESAFTFFFAPLNLIVAVQLCTLSPFERYSESVLFWSHVTHPHFIGLLLAADVYRPAFSAKSPYIKGTVRDEGWFLGLGVAVWLVSLPCPSLRNGLIAITTSSENFLTCTPT